MELKKTLIFFKDFFNLFFLKILFNSMQGNKRNNNYENIKKISMNKKTK